MAAVAATGLVGTLAVAGLVGMDGTEIVHLAQAMAPVAVATVIVAVVAARALSSTSLVQRFVGVALVAVVVAAVNILVLTSQMFVSDHDAALVSVLLVYALGSGVAIAIATARASRTAIRRLETTAHELGRGNLDSRAGDVHGGPELDALATSLDTMAERLEQARASERRADTMRRDLVAAMSHDLRTPLSSLRAMVEAIDEEVVGDTETLRLYAFEMRRAVVQLVDLVDDLFELTQLDVERILAEPPSSRVQDVVHRAIDAVRSEVTRKHLSVHTELGTALDAPCSPRVARVLHNLLSNAVRHTPAEGTIRVTATKERSHIHIAVEDDGAGFSQEALPHLFEPFFREDPARSGAGAGLGLTLAGRIVEALGGRIGAERSDPRGARFWVELPVA
ncbi:MAG TPA: HAMP domain-containing sensor histidine kinase [Actinomycetota bacterium]